MNIEKVTGDLPHIKTHSNFEMSKTLISGNKNVNNLFKALLLIKYEPISTMKFYFCL